MGLLKKHDPKIDQTSSNMGGVDYFDDRIDGLQHFRGIAVGV